MIIALSGPMGSGKSTAVEILKFMVRDMGVNKPIKVIKFAQPLYDMQEMIYRRISSVYGRPTSFVKDRKLLQYLGTEWGRETIGETIWVDLWEKEVKTALQDGYVVVCDDARFDNEAESVRRMEGYLIKIVADQSHRRADNPNGIANHASEAGIKDVYANTIISNNSTLDEYDSLIREVFKKVLTPLSGQKTRA
jgi:hypothetical protein